MIDSRGVTQGVKGIDQNEYRGLTDVAGVTTGADKLDDLPAEEVS